MDNDPGPYRYNREVPGLQVVSAQSMLAGADASNQVQFRVMVAWTPAELENRAEVLQNAWVWGVRPS